MFRANRGHAVVEFALCLPIVLALFFAPIQALRLWYRQFSLERRAFDVARALGGEAGDAAHLLSVATALAGAGTAVTVAVRPLAAAVTAPPRRPRGVDAVDVSLRAAAGLGFPFPDVTCTAHAREIRLRETP